METLYTETSSRKLSRLCPETQTISYVHEFGFSTVEEMKWLPSEENKVDPKLQWHPLAKEGVTNLWLKEEKNKESSKKK
jgi:hypothetical protein